VELAELAPDSTSLLMAIFPLGYQIGDPSWDDALAAVARIAEDTAIPALNLLPALRERGPASFLDASHLSLSGHETVAAALADLIRSRVPAESQRPTLDTPPRRTTLARL
jgi:hypothetical protein